MGHNEEQSKLAQELEQAKTANRKIEEGKQSLLEHEMKKNQDAHEKALANVVDTKQRMINNLIQRQTLQLEELKKQQDNAHQNSKEQHARVKKQLDEQIRTMKKMHQRTIDSIHESYKLAM